MVSMIEVRKASIKIEVLTVPSQVVQQRANSMKLKVDRGL